MQKILNAYERRDWLRLWRTENVSPITFRQLLKRFGSAGAALNALPDMAQRGGRPSFKLPPAHMIEDEIARTEKMGGRVIGLCEPNYPEALAAIEDAPPLITVLGNAKLLHKQLIAIVGARKSSLNGHKLCESFARELGATGIVIVSGMARGIDTSAHQASVKTGSVAVLAGGADVVYPEENRALYERLLDEGCVVSDQPLGCEPYAKLFPRRNRMISGLSLGVVVIEAALQSGSLITARMALEQGREVFAVPGSPLDPRCIGTNDLIRQGALLVEKASDVLAHMQHIPDKRLVGAGEAPIPAFEILEPIDENELIVAREVILEYLGPSPISVEDLIRRTAFMTDTVLTVLMELELAGQLERYAGHKVVLLIEPQDDIKLSVTA